jgi:hypothetical protein
MENFYSLLDTVSQKTGLKLAAYTYTPTGAQQPDMFTITFKVYVYVKGAYEDIAPAAGTSEAGTDGGAEVSTTTGG